MFKFLLSKCKRSTAIHHFLYYYSWYLVWILIIKRYVVKNWNRVVFVTSLRMMRMIWSARENFMTIHLWNWNERWKHKKQTLQNNLIASWIICIFKKYGYLFRLIFLGSSGWVSFGRKPTPWIWLSVLFVKRYLNFEKSRLFWRNLELSFNFKVFINQSVARNFWWRGSIKNRIDWGLQL